MRSLLRDSTLDETICTKWMGWYTSPDESFNIHSIVVTEIRTYQHMELRPNWVNEWSQQEKTCPTRKTGCQKPTWYLCVSSCRLTLALTTSFLSPVEVGSALGTWPTPPQSLPRDITVKQGVFRAKHPSHKDVHSFEMPLSSRLSSGDDAMWG